MSVGAPPELERAVASLVAQAFRWKSSSSIQVVATIHAPGADGALIRIVCRERAVARSDAQLGIAGTTPPFAFSARLTAQPGWAANRLQRHHDGATRLRPLINNNRAIIRYGQHFALFGRRLRCSRACIATARVSPRLFDEYGLFRETSGPGRTQFADRLPTVAARRAPVRGAPAPPIRSPCSPINIIGRRMAAAAPHCVCAWLRAGSRMWCDASAIARESLLATTGGARDGHLRGRCSRVASRRTWWVSRTAAAVVGHGVTSTQSATPRIHGSSDESVRYRDIRVKAALVGGDLSRRLWPEQ
jgi:hypothetical protein